MPLTNDANNSKTLRCMFDKALLVTCTEGLTDNSRAQFEKFNTLLFSKSWVYIPIRSQQNLFDENGHWPIVDDGPISVKECINRVDSIQNKLKEACGFLDVVPKVRIGIFAAISVIAEAAKYCCTTHGFWKTCIQLVVDAWKKVDLFGIPPDPYWD